MNKATINFISDGTYSLLDFLIEKLENSKNSIKNMISNSCVYVNGNVITKMNYTISKEDEIFVILKQIVDKNYRIDIIYEDKYFIAINKPSGLLSVSTSTNDYTAYSIVREYINSTNKKLFVLHRLDRDTSGILLFCKDYKLKEYMQNNWNNIVTKRGYLGIVNGHYDSGNIKSYLYEDKNYVVKSSKEPKKGKLALTNYKCIKKCKNTSLLQIYIDTGRKNQIRVHMNDIGTYILGDKKYGKGKYKRLYLHSNILSFIHPITKKETTIKCMPNDFLI